MSSTPTPLSSLVGGIGLAFPVHALLRLNGNVFGISGFLHCAVRGSMEGLLGVAGLFLGGIVVGFVEGHPPPDILRRGLFPLVVSGLVVGIGTKLSNGCTSGHMICGISRFSIRSIAATCTFLTSASITAAIFHRQNAPAPTTSYDWTLGASAKALVALQTIPLVVEVMSFYLISNRKWPRHLTFFLTSFHFALALAVSNLTDPQKVLGFLLLPIHPSFDPSLGSLALGAMPLSMLLYRFFRGTEVPRFGDKWSVPRGGKVDARLLLGATFFGVGWGMSGVCPGPGLVNFGRAMASGSGIFANAIWLGAVVVGGLLAGVRF